MSDMNKCPMCGAFPFSGIAQAEHGSEFFHGVMGRLIDWAQGHVAQGKVRAAYYCGLIDEFERYGVVNLDVLLGRDPMYDEAYHDMHHWEPEDGRSPNTLPDD